MLLYALITILVLNFKVCSAASNHPKQAAQLTTHECSVASCKVPKHSSGNQSYNVNMLPGNRSMRMNYSQGVSTYYKEHGPDYSNPHEDAIVRCVDSLLAPIRNELDHGWNAVDIACGSGEAMFALLQFCQHYQKSPPNIIAVDPFTRLAVTRRFPTIEFLQLSFEDIGHGDLPGKYDLAISSFALHLADRSELFALLAQLAVQARYLAIVSPHKLPFVPDGCGWELQHSVYTGGSGQERVRGRLFQSLWFSVEKS